MNDKRSNGSFDTQDITIPEVYEEWPGVTSSSSAQKSKELGRAIIDKKQRDYTTASHRYRALYYGTRLIAGLASGLLPFVVNSHADVATALAITIVVAVVFDSTFDPKGRWQLFSRASDLLAIARLKASGQFEKYREELEILVATESQKLEKLVDLETIIKKVSEVERK